MADHLDCYAVVNKKYRKPENIEKSEDYPADYQVDLNLWDNFKNSSNAKTHFLGPIDKFKDEILKSHKSMLILHIHGIGNQNLKKVADLLPEHKRKPGEIDFLIGYGQRKNDNSRFTADFEKVVGPLLSPERGLKAALAPVDPIIDEEGEERWYCGNDPNRMNQALSNLKDNIQSLQFEFRQSGLRDSAEGMAEASKNISKALIEVWGAVISELETEQMRAVYDELMPIWIKKSESTMYKAGWLLLKSFYNTSIEDAKADRKKAKLKSLYQYIQALHTRDSTAPKKSWIYNSVKLVIEYKELRSYLKTDFHLYGNGLSLSHKVLLFPINNLELKAQLIREASGKDVTVAYFREKVAALKVIRKNPTSQKPSLLRCIGKPEMVFSEQMSKFLEPAVLRSMPLQAKEKLQAGVIDCISRLKKKIEIETGYLKRYQQLVNQLKDIVSIDASASKH